MNTRISISIAAALLSLGAVSCSEKWEPQPVTGLGELALASMSVDVNTSTSEISRTGVDLSPFLVTITPESGGEPKEYVYGAMPEIVSLAVGNYTVKVRSHEVQKAEWERPYYLGERKFEIRNKELTEIGVVTASMSSLKVTVSYTEKLHSLMGDDATVTVVANDEGSLVYGPDETRAGYFEVVDGSMTMVATFRGSVGGQYVEKVVSFNNVKAGEHYSILFSTKVGPEPPQQTGGVDPSGMTVDGEVTNETVGGNIDPGDEPIIDDNDRPGQEEGGDTPPPGPDDRPAATFNSTTVNLEGENDASTWSGPAVVTIGCPEGFAHLVVRIDSEGLTPDVLAGVGLDSEFDLAYPGNLKEGLEGLGFKTGADVIGKTTMDFDITDFVPLLNIYPGKSDFMITVTDSKGKQSQAILKFKS